MLIHSENCPEMVLSWLACATLGAVAVTTNTKSVGAEITYFAEHTGAVAAITQPQYAAMVADAAPALKWIAVTDDNSGEPADATHAGARLRRASTSLFGDAGDCDAARRRSRCCRSGSCSPPAPRAARRRSCTRTPTRSGRAAPGPRNIDLSTDDTYLIFLPFFHVNAQSWSLFSVLGVGATAVLMPKWSQSRFWPMVVEHGVTHISVMPFVMGALGSPDRADRAHAARRRVRADHARPRPDVRDRGLRRLRHDRDGHALRSPASRQEQLPTRSMGHVTPGYEIAVVDKDTGELCAEGETGELWMRGTRGIQLFLEYYDNDEANAKAFEDGWFKTGDMVKMGAGGNVFYQERDKDLLKVGGENVSAKEVEDLIVAHPAVQAVAVVGKQHDFLERGRGRVRDPGARRPRPRTIVDAEIIETVRREPRDVQGAARRLLRRRVPDRHARQDPQEQAPRDGRRAAAGRVGRITGSRR